MEGQFPWIFITGLLIGGLARAFTDEELAVDQRVWASADRN
jgi:hypothetical protein